MGQRTESLGTYILILRAIRRRLYVSVSYDRNYGAWSIYLPSTFKDPIFGNDDCRRNILVQKLLELLHEL